MASTPTRTNEEADDEEYLGGLDPDDALDMLPNEEEFAYEED